MNSERLRMNREQLKMSKEHFKVNKGHFKETREQRPKMMRERQLDLTGEIRAVFWNKQAKVNRKHQLKVIREQLTVCGNNLR